MHDGHVFFLNSARELVNELVVVVARDESVMEIKRRPPRTPLEKRIEVLEKSGLADKVVVGDLEKGSWKILHEHKPDVVILGYDQTDLGAALRATRSNLSFSFEIEILGSHHPDKFKSSLINHK